MLWPPARGIREVFGDEVESFSYFDESAASITGAVVDLAQYIAAHGPFDGVIGFSQGAVLAATLIIAQRQTHGSSFSESSKSSSSPTPHGRLSPPRLPVDPLLAAHLPRQAPFRCAVFLCGGLPFDWHALARGTVELITPSSCPAEREGDSSSNQGASIHIPVVNCWAQNDEDYPGMGPPLSQLCARENNQQVVHGVGHAVPSEGHDLMALVSAVQATLDRVS